MPTNSRFFFKKAEIIKKTEDCIRKFTDISKEYNINVAAVSNLKKRKVKNFTILDALHLLNEAREMISSD